MVKQFFNYILPDFYGTTIITVASNRSHYWHVKQNIYKYKQQENHDSAVETMIISSKAYLRHKQSNLTWIMQIEAHVLD